MVARKGSEGAATDRTAMELKSDREIIITRTFDAPARLVFDAWTKPELVRRWWAPTSRGVSMASCEADVRAGGAYRYVLRLRSGDDVAFSGTYTEVTPYTRLVYTQIFEQMADAGAAIVTITLHEREGQTRLESHELYPSPEARDAALESGMEDGMRETMNQFDELVTSLR